MKKIILGMALFCAVISLAFAGGRKGGYDGSSSGTSSDTSTDMSGGAPGVPSNGTSAGSTGGTVRSFAKLVVTPFENRGAQLDTAALNNLQDYLINAFINTGRFQLPDRNALALLAQEQKFQLSDWADDSKSAQMGRVLNADYIVRVIVMHDGEYNLLTARILDVNTANGLSAAEMEFITQREARGKMDEFVGKILQRITGGGQSAPRRGSATANTGKVYKPGDLGPAGGIVFYDKGTFSNGWRYLEAAPVETEFTAQWGAYQKDVSSTVTSLGSGKRNTQVIIKRLRQLKESGKAAQLCVNLDFDGYKDWFLPSRDELNLMYTNLKKKGLGGFSDGWYWSSSQYYNEYYNDGDSAWRQNFGGGRQEGDGKNGTPSVRAVRAF
jgi:TolB-like protein